MKIPKSKLSKNSLKERAIVVTGAGSGIGRALSFELAKNNADLILLSRDQIKLDSLQDEIKEKFGIEPLTVEFDFFKAKEKDYNFLIENLIDNYTKIDGLVHVAGILGYLSPFTSTSPSQLETVMKINFESNFLLTKGFDAIIRKIRVSISNIYIFGSRKKRESVLDILFNLKICCRGINAGTR